MKLLILSDIHANWPALEALLHNEGSWDGVAFCGDVVGVGPQPVECVRWVAEHAEFRVRGDLDNALAFGLDCHGAGSFREAPPITRTWHSRLLAPVDLAFLRSLPTIDWFEWDGRHFRIPHASPQNEVSLPGDRVRLGARTEVPSSQGVAEATDSGPDSTLKSVESP